MAEGLNRVMLLGNLCADPEVRVTQGGQAVCHLRLATNETYLDKDRVRQERVDFHNVTIWGKRGAALGKILTKGSSIFVEGSLRTSSYDNREGQKVYKTEINANNILLVGGRGQGGQSAPPADDGGYGDEGAPPRGGQGRGGGYGRGGGGGQGQREERGHRQGHSGPRGEAPQDTGDYPNNPYNRPTGGGNGGGAARAPATPEPGGGESDGGGYGSDGDGGGYGGDDDSDIPF